MDIMSKLNECNEKGIDDNIQTGLKAIDQKYFYSTFYDGFV